MELGVAAKILFRVPPNCRFEIDDFELEWKYSYPFEFIHARNIEGSVKDHRRLFRQALENLKEGGWLEVADSTVGVFCDDETIERAPNLLEWQDRLIEASQKFGKPMAVAHQYKDWLIDAGFTNVKEEVYKVRVGRPTCID
jgi:trans-aconitate methyltransferase